MAFKNKLEQNLFGNGLWKPVTSYLADRIPDKFSTMDEFIAAGGASSYGEGNVIISGSVYWCDGINVSIFKSNLVDKPLAILFGDSIIAGGNSLIIGVSVSKTTSTSATFTAAGHGMAPGNKFWFSGADDINGWGLFTVDTRINNNTFTTTVPESFPSTIPSTGNTKQIINQVRQNDRNFIAGALNELNCTKEILNFGASGLRLNQMLPVIKREIQTRKPNIVYIGAGTNDVLQLLTADSIISNINDVVDFASRNCDTVLIATLPPIRSLLPGYVAAMGVSVLKINTAIRSLSDNYVNVRVIDLFGDWCQSTANDYNPSFALDNVHPNGTAAQKTIAQVKSSLQNIIPYSPYRASVLQDRPATDASLLQLNSNPIMNGSGGTVLNAFVGQVAADTYQLTSSGTFSSALASKETRTDNRGFNQIIEVTGASSGASIDFLGIGFQSSISAGQKLKSFFDIEVSNAANISSINIYMELIIDGVTYISTTPMYASGGTYILSNSFRRYLSTNKIIVPEGTITTARQRVQVNFSTNGSITIKIGCMSVERS